MRALGYLSVTFAHVSSFLLKLFAWLTYIYQVSHFISLIFIFLLFVRVYYTATQIYIDRGRNTGSGISNEITYIWLTLKPGLGKVGQHSW